MTVLNEGSRRFLTLVLFVLLGPSLFFLVGYEIFSRYSRYALQKEECRLSQFVDGSVCFSNREFLRPRARRLINVTIMSALRDCVAFCPEVYLIEEKDREFIKKYASGIDYCSNKISKDNSEEKHIIDSSASKDVYQDLTDGIFNAKCQTLESLIFADKNEDSLCSRSILSKKKAYSLIVIPEIYCRENQPLDIRTTLMNVLNRAMPFQEELNRIVGVAIGKLHVVDSSEILPSADGECKRKSSQELASYFNVLTASSAAVVSQQLSDAEIEDRMRVFESEAPVIDNIKLLYIDNGKTARIDAIFETSKIFQEGTARRYISIETNREHCATHFRFDSSDAPTPISLLARFAPFFRGFGLTCWFSGKIVGDSFSTKSAFIPIQSNQFEQDVEGDGTNITPKTPLWRIQLQDVHIQNCKLDTLSARLILPTLTGKISDLTIDKGTIRQGVFEGRGTISIQNGTIPVDVLNKLCKASCLEIFPNKILNYQYLNEAVPFNEFELQFKMSEKGIVFDSQYQNKIVGCYENGNVKYGFFLPQATAGRPLPYSRPLFALVDSTGEDVFRSPLFKEVLNHLPVALPSKTALNSSDQNFRRR